MNAVRQEIEAEVNREMEQANTAVDEFRTDVEDSWNFVLGVFDGVKEVVVEYRTNFSTPAASTSKEEAAEGVVPDKVEPPETAATNDLRTESESVLTQQSSSEEPSVKQPPLAQDGDLGKDPWDD